MSDSQKYEPAPRTPDGDEPRIGFVEARDERSIFMKSLERVKEAMKQLAGKDEGR